jgi:hypothetical protein
MAYVTIINEHQHVQQVVSGHHHLTADEAVAAGGSDAGFAPRELLLASLGTCTAVALRKHAVQNDWTLGKITVGVRWSRDTSGGEHGKPGHCGFRRSRASVPVDVGPVFRRMPGRVHVNAEAEVSMFRGRSGRRSAWWRGRSRANPGGEGGWLADSPVPALTSLNW